jgi:Lon protease-like protein
MTFSDTLQEMPVTIPIFPLEGVLLLPGGDLPLNIFEAPYLAMIKAAMGGDRLIGMIQPCTTPEKLPDEATKPFYKVGCVGRISSFEETPDGRFLINLHGMIRFNLLSHRMTDDGYRLAEVDFPSYAKDFKECDKLPDELKRPQLIEKMQVYLGREGLSIDWDAASHIPDQRFYTLLAMICPFTPAEKQALLEASDFKERCKMMKCLMDISCADDENRPCTERPC